MNSPWINQLNHHIYPTLLKDVSTDVFIIGAGISGALTAFEVLTRTDKRVLLVDAGKVGHGATGHNAGQLTHYFERAYHTIVDEFGVDMAAAGQAEIFKSWQRVKKIFKKTNIKVPHYLFWGYAGVSTLEQLDDHLANKFLRRQGGVSIEKIYVGDSFDISKINKKYAGLYQIAKDEFIKEKLNTGSDEFIALLETRKGTMNSSLFTETLVKYMSSNFKDRFEVFTETKVSDITLMDKSVLIKTNKSLIEADKVVLCTNGFENFNIVDMGGENLNKSFHEEVHGRVAYMLGYLEKSQPDTPTAITYFPTEYDIKNKEEADYYYLTRRPYEVTKDISDTLLCIGGPTEKLAMKMHYDKDTHQMPSGIEKNMDAALEKYYKYHIKHIEYKYRWHGLMGYTRNSLRLVGEDKLNARLLYNLGCNGVGIMPAFFGAERVARLIDGEKFEKSIFDPSI